MGRILFIGAHPDDEVFGPGATLAKYASAGHEVKIICATKGENGMWSDVVCDDNNLSKIREKEHLLGAKILGINSIDYLNYVDGAMANKDMEMLVEVLTRKVICYYPDIIITFDQMGISGHIDHIIMSLATMKVFEITEGVKKLYFYTLQQEDADKIGEKKNRLIWGRRFDEITTFIDVQRWIPQKIEAAKAHATQKADTDTWLPYWEENKTDCFVLTKSRVETTIPESDLWTGI